MAAAQYKQAVARAQESLFASYFDQARASRSSRQPGQRFAALAALRKAASIHRTPELRDEAIACLALPDLEPVRRRPVIDKMDWIDPSFTWMAYAGHEATITIRRVEEDREFQRIEPRTRSLTFPAASATTASTSPPPTPRMAEAGRSAYRIGVAEPVVVNSDPGAT